MFVMATRALDTVGFPALLNEALRRANFICKPEYEVHARGYAIGFDEYMARLYLSERKDIGIYPHAFQACGTTPEMAVQEVARVTLIHLRYELPELWGDVFTYLPMQGPGDVCPYTVTIPVGAPPRERYMAETISIYERAYRSVKAELDETRRRLHDFQVGVELKVRTKKAPRTLLDDLPREPLQENIAPSHRFPHVNGVWAETRSYNPIPMGLHVRRFNCVRTTREALLGAPEHFFP
ncbi:unnamed protein product [Urochloa decumbens]|uniref:Uncharacterized protein n=1 Tax=Urochloa decumbens TaxID=240449 RepID=A0ABC8XCW5_9POAL